jgi:hypothetical protein
MNTNLHEVPITQLGICLGEVLKKPLVSESVSNIIDLDDLLGPSQTPLMASKMPQVSKGGLSYAVNAIISAK